MIFRSISISSPAWRSATSWACTEPQPRAPTWPGRPRRTARASSHSASLASTHLLRSVPGVSCMDRHRHIRLHIGVAVGRSRGSSRSFGLASREDSFPRETTKPSGPPVEPAIPRASTCTTLLLTAACSPHPRPWPGRPARRGSTRSFEACGSLPFDSCSATRRLRLVPSARGERESGQRGCSEHQVFPP
jgi:hypothetical protein